MYDIFTTCMILRSSKEYREALFEDGARGRSMHHGAPFAVSKLRHDKRVSTLTN